MLREENPPTIEIRSPDIRWVRQFLEDFNKAEQEYKREPTRENKAAFDDMIEIKKVIVLVIQGFYTH